jgi:hypothetical protein
MTCLEIQDMLSDYLFDLLSPDERRCLESHLHKCQKCGEALEELKRSFSMLECWEDREPPSALRATTISALTEKKDPWVSRWIPRLRYAFGFIAVAYMVATGATISLQRFLPMEDQQTLFSAPSVLYPDAPASFRIVVQTLRGEHPVKGARVEVEMKNSDTGKTVRLFSGITDRQGTVEPRLTVPSLPEGSYTLTVTSRSLRGRNIIHSKVSMEQYCRILLSTDRPVYQPDQTIHIRSLAVLEGNRKCPEGGTAVFEVEDPKGNKVYRKTEQIKAFGVASTDFVLAREINLGNYHIRATIGKDKAERVVEVKRYVLPKFRIAFEPSRKLYKPGETITGTVRCAYFFGKPVQKGQVSIELSTFDVAFHTITSLQGKTDNDGEFRPAITIPSYMAGQPLEKGKGLLKCDIAITDSAGHKERITEMLHVAENADTDSTAPDGGKKLPITIDIIPERKSPISGIEQRIFVITTLPGGSSPLSCDVTLDTSEKVLHGTTDRFGIAEFPVTLGKRRYKLKAEARKGRDCSGSAEITINTADASDGLLLRTDSALYTVGKQLKASVFSEEPGGTVYIDLLRNGQTLLTKSVSLSGGRGELNFDLADDCAGTLTIDAYRIHGALSDSLSGTTVRDRRTVIVLPSKDLIVAAKADRKSYRPGDRAHIGFLVRDDTGVPVQAAIGVNIVDESVFALAERHPGLEKIYFALEREIMEPRAEVCTHNKSLTVEKITKAPQVDITTQRAAEVLLTTLPQEKSLQILSSLWDTEERYRRIKDQLGRAVNSMLLILPFVLCALVFFITCGSMKSKGEITETEGFSITRKFMLILLGFSLIGVGLTPMNLDSILSAENIILCLRYLPVYSWLLLPILMMVSALRRQLDYRWSVAFMLSLALVMLVFKVMAVQIYADMAGCHFTDIPEPIWFILIASVTSLLIAIGWSLGRMSKWWIGLLISILSLALLGCLFLGGSPAPLPVWIIAQVAGNAILLCIHPQWSPLGSKRRDYGLLTVSLLLFGFSSMAPVLIQDMFYVNSQTGVLQLLQIVCTIAFFAILLKVNNTDLTLKFSILITASLLVLGAAASAPDIIQSIQLRYYNVCKSNVRNMGTAFEMYSCDNQGRYPHSLSKLTPNYLRSLPTCPAAGRVTYSYVYTEVPDCYTVWCNCHCHMSRIPEYDAVQGLFEDGGGDGNHESDMRMIGSLEGGGLRGEQNYGGTQTFEPRKVQGSLSSVPDPRVRQFFPETLYWNPLIITDEKGKAEIEVPIADSITTWRLAATASTKEGIIGSVTNPLAVFQDFFIEPDMPEHLTRGDTITVPVAVYNYLPRPQTISVSLKSADWCETTGPTSKSVNLGASDVRAVRFTIRAKRVGDFRFTVEGRSSERADAVSKPIRVDPEGKETEVTQNGKMETKAACTITIPSDSVPGGSTVLVKVYPGMTTQIVDGLEGMLQMPYG